MGFITVMRKKHS